MLDLGCLDSIFCFLFLACQSLSRLLSFCVFVRKPWVRPVTVVNLSKRCFRLDISCFTPYAPLLSSFFFLSVSFPFSLSSFLLFHLISFNIFPVLSRSELKRTQQRITLNIRDLVTGQPMKAHHAMHTRHGSVPCNGGARTRHAFVSSGDVNGAAISPHVLRLGKSFTTIMNSFCKDAKDFLITSGKWKGDILKPNA